MQSSSAPDATTRFEALAGFDTATLFESAEQPQMLVSEIRPIDTGFRIVGPALTAACPGGDNLMLHLALADAAPGEVLVVQCHDASFGVWGEVLMTAAIAKGVKALVIDGAVRDVDALRAARFPVFTRAIAMKGAAKKRRGVMRQPISCGGALVWPGDIVVADDSGVLILGRSELEGVIAKAKARQSKEAAMMAELKRGMTTVELLQLSAVAEAAGAIAKGSPPQKGSTAR